MSYYFKEIRKLSKFNKTEYSVKYFSKYPEILELINVKKTIKGIYTSVSVDNKTPFTPEISDLARLHFLIISGKPLTVLEFGSGFSTYIIAHALKILSLNSKSTIDNEYRITKPFHLYSVEESSEFLEISKNRLRDLNEFVTFIHSYVRLENFNGNLVTYYDSLPNISPDLIYLDGPSQYATQTKFNGLSFNIPQRYPISMDILLYEWFLEPGAQLLIDGRTTNARFLIKHLDRNWKFKHDKFGDFTYLELIEKPLGVLNYKKIGFRFKKLKFPFK
jgi:hypothetical protein